MSLIELVKVLRNEGFKQNRARVKVCQEVFMTKLALSTYTSLSFLTILDKTL